MTDDNVTRLPEPGVVLDLDAWERPASEKKPPFTTKVAGKVISFVDPADIDWRDLASIRIPSDLFSVSLSSEDRAHIREQPMSGAKFNHLMKTYYEYYDFEDKIRQAQRQNQGI